MSIYLFVFLFFFFRECVSSPLFLFIVENGNIPVIILFYFNWNIFLLKHRMAMLQQSLAPHAFAGLGAAPFQNNSTDERCAAAVNNGSEWINVLSPLHAQAYCIIMRCVCRDWSPLVSATPNRLTASMHEKRSTTFLGATHSTHHQYSNTFLVLYSISSLPFIHDISGRSQSNSNHGQHIILHILHNFYWSL